MTDKEKAALRILETLRSRLALMTVPHREEAYALAEKYELTALEILEVAYRKVKDT